MPCLRLACCIALVAASAAIPNAAAAAVLAVGQGYGGSPETARAAARADLAVRLQRRAAMQLDGASGKTAVAVQRAIAGGRELPLIEIELASTGGSVAEVLYQARLTDASLAAYAREARRLAQGLRRLDSTTSAASDAGNALARLDQYLRILAVLALFSPASQPEFEFDEALFWSSAAKNLSPAGGAKDVALRVKQEVKQAGARHCRIIAPVRADTAEVTALSASIADGLVGGAGGAARDESPACTLDGRYTQRDGRLVLALFLLDASFNTQRAFVYVLPAVAEHRSPALSAPSGLAATLGRGLVRVDLPGGTAASSSAGAMNVDVRMGRGNRALYYRPGQRDKLLVKLDRAGYYYIVGHVQKEAERFSYLLEIGEPGSSERFVRRVAADLAHRWQTAVEFTVEAPVGLEAVQVFATSEPPQKMLPPTRFDPGRKLYLIGTDPVDAIKRARGLVLVNVPDARNEPGGKAKPAALTAGEAVLQFSTLP
jgi:hypothetical protein